MRRILVIGTGYVGLVTGACLAEMGHLVTCLDIDRDKIALLKEGKLPFYEPGLAEIVQRSTHDGRLHFTTSYEEGLNAAEICFLALPTPSGENGESDLSYIFSAAASIGRLMDSPLVIVNKSTVPVGTAQKVKEIILENLGDKTIEFDVVSNPEFLREGSAVSDCMKPDRIILGVENARAEEIMRKLYACFTLNHERFLVMDIASAELSKYAANAMLATRISFMNELAGLCEKLGANIKHIRQAIGSDHRIGYHYLYPGIGFGGSCLPKDLRSLKSVASEQGYATALLDSVEAINLSQQKAFIEKVFSQFPYLSGKTFALWGLSFKPETDDIREAPSLFLIESLLREGATLRVYDPVAMDNVKALFGDALIYCENEYEAAEGADGLILVTEWKQFRFADLPKVLSLMKGETFFDGRNQYDPSEMAELGFSYHCLGSASQTALASL